MNPARKDNHAIWECTAILASVFAWIFIALQIRQEMTATLPTTLSRGYALGFLSIMVFWTFYGIHFRRTAVWLGNAVAAILQTILAFVAFLR